MAADNAMSIEPVEDQARTGHADVAGLCKNNVDAFMASSQALIGSCQTMHAVLLAFLQSRAKEGLAAGKRLTECGSPQSALEIQLDFAREALQAYADQFHTLGKIAGEALNGCAMPRNRRLDMVSERGADSSVAA
jgi:hypothetical protein